MNRNPRPPQPPITTNGGQLPTQTYVTQPAVNPAYSESDITGQLTAPYPHEHGFAFHFVLRLFPSVYTYARRDEIFVWGLQSEV